jgi:type IV pilus assembly protein PilA
MTKQIKSKGFTIVELLIVIVVIAILAAITIVAYNGIQQRAHTTAQKTTAENLAKKIEAFNSINNAYPQYSTSSTVTSQLANDASTALGNSIKITAATAVTSTNPDNTVELDLCSNSSSALTSGTAANGYVIYIYDQTKGSRDAVQAGGNMSITINSGSTLNTVNPSSGVTCTTLGQ